MPTTMVLKTSRILLLVDLMSRKYWLFIWFHSHRPSSSWIPNTLVICTITFAEFKSVWPLIKYNRKYKNNLLGTWNFWILRKFQYWSASIWKPTNRHPLGLPCHPGLSLLLQHLPSCLKSSSYEMSHSLCNWPSKFVHPIIRTLSLWRLFVQFKNSLTSVFYRMFIWLYILWYRE